jgi:hypothetical protein
LKLLGLDAVSVEQVVLGVQPGPLQAACQTPAL